MKASLTPQQIRPERPRDKSRDVRLDLLKVVGLAAIILAHTAPPAVIHNIRAFDVPLMVMVSGVLFSYGLKGREYAYGRYLARRIPRLLLPTWIFLCIFFAVAFVIFTAAGRSFPYTGEDMLGSFELTTFKGIGYVWIIRVFLLIAIVSPLILQLYKICGKKDSFLAVISVIYIFYEAALYLGGGMSYFMDEIFFYALPYGCIFGLGLHLPSMKVSSIFNLSVFFMTIFLIVGGYYYYAGAPLYITTYKYPPRILFVAYTSSVSLILYLLAMRFELKNDILRRVVVFMSSSSLWIYLWHILIKSYWDLIVKSSVPGADKFYIAFIVFIVMASVITYMQKTLVTAITERLDASSRTTAFFVTAFLK